MPLGLTTRVLGADGDLTGALADLADGRVAEIVEVPVRPDRAEPPTTTGRRRRRSTARREPR